MAEMLCVKGMSLCQFTDFVNCSFVDPFVRSDEMFPNKRLPLFLGDRAQRIMSAGAVKRPIFVEHHLLNQVFATAEKDVANAAVILNDAAQPSLNVIAPVLQQLLKLVQDDYDAGACSSTRFWRVFPKLPPAPVQSGRVLPSRMRASVFLLRLR